MRQARASIACDGLSAPQRLVAFKPPPDLLSIPAFSFLRCKAMGWKKELLEGSAKGSEGAASREVLHPEFGVAELSSLAALATLDTLAGSDFRLYGNGMPFLTLSCGRLRGGRDAGAAVASSSSVSGFRAAEEGWRAGSLLMGREEARPAHESLPLPVVSMVLGLLVEPFGRPRTRFNAEVEHAELKSSKSSRGRLCLGGSIDDFGFGSSRGCCTVILFCCAGILG
mmetsp:Transcript_9972/g.16633  ORF Transcript_9972/g.16633 Transcript_9972/m.16633 type:complete len:226 (+) Transcript_9972:588-1265(+)